ncbi:MAG: hypothetical protein DCC68_08895 [Planctomycetota bacterium]|nr:MAG: hypothetical protein DCC68_08895 [Planctomycetota bacterium]
MPRKQDFDPSVALPPGLDVAQIRKAIEYVEREASDLVEIYFEQANVFSAIIGILGTKAMDQVSCYEKHRNIDTAQQRFPDLKRRGSGANPTPNNSLESKGSKRPWAIQSHYDHPGWYIVWRYLVDTTKMIQSDKSVIIWRVDVVFLERGDWKYEGSGAGVHGGGRTHTFGVTNPAKKLNGKAVYARKDVVIRNSKPVPVNGDHDE